MGKRERWSCLTTEWLHNVSDKALDFEEFLKCTALVKCHNTVILINPEHLCLWNRTFFLTKFVSCELICLHSACSLTFWHMRSSAVSYELKQILRLSRYIFRQIHPLTRNNEKLLCMVNLFKSRMCKNLKFRNKSGQWNFEISFYRNLGPCHTQYFCKEYCN